MLSLVIIFLYLNAIKSKRLSNFQYKRRSSFFDVFENFSVIRTHFNNKSLNPNTRVMRILIITLLNVKRLIIIIRLYTGKYIKKTG